jgi:hypothetical protein
MRHNVGTLKIMYSEIYFYFFEVCLTRHKGMSMFALPYRDNEVCLTRHKVSNIVVCPIIVLKDGLVFKVLVADTNWLWIIVICVPSLK